MQLVVTNIVSESIARSVYNAKSPAVCHAYSPRKLLQDRERCNITSLKALTAVLLCYAVQTGKQLLFRRFVLPPSPGPSSPET